MEHALHAIWQRVLDIQDIDSNASFFALCVTSLDTIRVKGDIKRQPVSYTHLDVYKRQLL